MIIMLDMWSNKIHFETFANIIHLNPLFYSLGASGNIFVLQDNIKVKQN